MFSFSYCHTLQISIQLRRASTVVCPETHNQLLDYSCLIAVKQWIWKNWHNVQAAKYPEITLLESSAVVTVGKCRGWFMHSGYNVM